MSYNVENKAQEYAEGIYTPEALPAKPNSLHFKVLENARKQLADAYLAGHAEALRWRKCSEEMPPEGERMLCLVAGERFKFPSVWGWMGNNWSINVGDPHIGSHKNITHWRPIGDYPQIKIS